MHPTFGIRLLLFRITLIRSWKRLRYGKPPTEIIRPFDLTQATSVLNAVLGRGTFSEINKISADPGRLGYAAVPSQADPSWQIVPIPEWHTYIEQYASD